MMADSLRLGLDRWRAWQQQSVHRRIFGVTLTVGLLTVGVKLVAILKEAVVAHQFGTGDALEAFLIAMVLPQFAINLVGGSLNAALIPTYIHVRERAGAEAAHRLFASVTALSLTILIVLSIALGVAAPVILPLIASGFPAWKLALAASAFRWLLPTLVLAGLTTTWSAVLNAGDRFAIAAAAPAATAILTLALVGLKGPDWGLDALVAGTLGGAVLETALIGWGLARRGISLMPRWRGLSDDVKQVIGQYTPMLTGAFLMGGTAVVSQSMAAMLDPGSVSVLAYGSKLTTLVLGIMAVAVSTAVLPPFSRMVAVGEWTALRHALRTYSRLLLAVTVPMTILLIALSRPLVVILFQRGAFTAADSQIVAWTQAMYLLHVPLFVVGMLLVRLISALRANRILMWGSGLNLAVNVVLTYVLMHRFGVAGIALATSLMYVGSVAFLWIAASRLLRAMPRQEQEQERQPIARVQEDVHR
jgi:putative peptidoglycan lipid II flippase